jgi:hypothetical protein
MHKFFYAICLVSLMFCYVPAQESTTTTPAATNSPVANELPNRGHAPTRPNGVGRADIRITDEDGNPIKGAKAHIKSNYTKNDGHEYECEAWDFTNERGVVVPPPLRCGKLKITIKAKGYKTEELILTADQLAEPIKVTLKKS